MQMHDLLTCDKRSSKSSVCLQLSKFVVSQQRSATIDVRRHIRVFHMQQHEACEGVALDIGTGAGTENNEMVKFSSLISTSEGKC